MPSPAGAAPTPPGSEVAATRVRIERLAWLLDGAIPVPGTRFRFGLDSIIGLIPGVGDLLGLLLGATILYESVRIGAPRALVAKMLGNSVLDALLGVVPGIGDLADFAFKSNQRNVRLLIAHLDELDGKPKASGSLLLALALATLFVAAAGGLVLLAWRMLFG